MECTKIILYLVIQRPSRQVVHFTGTQYLLKCFSHGTKFAICAYRPQGTMFRLAAGGNPNEYMACFYFV